MAKGWGCAKRGKTTKKFASGGFVGAAGTNRGSWSGDGKSLGVKTGTVTGTSASNRAEAAETSNVKKTVKSAPKPIKAPLPAAKPPVPKAKPSMPGPRMGASLGVRDPWPGQSNIPTTRTAPGKGDREATSNAAPGKGDREATSNAAPGKTDRER
jgi:hypothetical protein